MPRYAEDMPYWATTVHPAKSQGEIVEMLEEFGASSLMIVQGQAGGKLAWLIRFQWEGQAYRFTFVPLECKDPAKVSSFGGKRQAHADQSRYQMGRIAVNFVKAILTAAEAQPAALFGFLELPGVQRHAGGLPFTAAEIDITGLSGYLPSIGEMLELPGGE